MSMNLSLGDCPLMQTTTEDTYKILASPDRFRAYMDCCVRMIQNSNGNGDDAFRDIEAMALKTRHYMKQNPDAKWEAC